MHIIRVSSPIEVECLQIRTSTNRKMLRNDLVCHSPMAYQIYRLHYVAYIYSTTLQDRECIKTKLGICLSQAEVMWPASQLKLARLAKTHFLLGSSLESNYFKFC